MLYSSGTTGLPKAIVHGHGGILVEHLKVLGLHTDVGPDDTLFWFTTTGWMMWNFVVSTLLVGARMVAFDGDPSGGGPDTLWQLAADERVTIFGVGAPFVTAASRSDLVPAEQFDLSALRVIGATGAPLSPAGFDWLYENVSPTALGAFWRHWQIMRRNRCVRFRCWMMRKLPSCAISARALRSPTIWWGGISSA